MQSLESINYSQEFQQTDKQLKLQKQMMNKNNIVNRYLNLDSGPENIEYQSLLSMSYYENYKGQNPNAPGKNILNIGEQHFTTDDGFNNFINFLTNLGTKNAYLNNCLDFIFENSLNFFGKSHFQSDIFTNLNQSENESNFTLLKLRKILNNQRNLKGFRVHDTDVRLGFYGFYSSLIYLLMHIEKLTSYVTYIQDNKLYEVIGVYIYDYNNTAYIKNKETSELHIWKMFVYLNFRNAIYFTRNSKNQQQKKYNQKAIELSQLRNNYINNFIKSVKEYMADEWKLMNIDEIDLIDEIPDSWFHNLSRDGYYNFLEKKKQQVRTYRFPEDFILNHKEMDKKFAKQIDNIDTDYFLDNPKDLIFGYFYSEETLQYRIRRFSSSMFYDIQTICRIFRKFDGRKRRFMSCDDENKSLRNLIIYSGNYHAQRINNFLRILPKLRLKKEFDNQYFDIVDERQGNKTRPIIQTGFSINDNYYSAEPSIPMNFDYFGYNRDIINQLKQEYNVQNYLQIEKKISERKDEVKKQQHSKQQKLQKQR